MAGEEETPGGGPDPLAELRGEIATLKQELAGLREASSSAEKREARSDVAEAEEDVAAAAKRAGLRPEQYRKAIEAARRQAFMDDYGEEIDRRVAEQLDTLLEQAAEGEGDKGDGEKGGEGKAEAGKKPKPEPKPKPKADGDEPPAGGDKGGEDEPPDTGPEHPHWSERPLSQLFGGR